MAAVNFGQDGGTIAGMAGNVFTDNIVISSFTGSQQTTSSGVNGFTFFENGGQPASDFTIENNLYYNYAGGRVDTSGNVASDASPIIANPLLSSTYQLSSNSPAFRSLNFTPIVGGWGPPGFVIPQARTAPSSAR